MTIQEANIVFVESQVMDDVPEGGGAATGRVITDGEMNNVFEDISDLDRAYGRFNLRKIFLAVRTISTDLFGGAKSVITQIPEDPAISYALFSTGDPFDTRNSAANRVAAYLYKGPMWPGWLHENHISGMQAINVLQRPNSELPPIGKTLVLVQNEGAQGELEQYIRVTSVDVAERTFVDTVGPFTMWEVTLGLSDSLRHNFNGHEARRLDSGYTYTTRARLRDTTVADATRYFGAMPLTAAGVLGERTLRAQSMFAALVPSAQTEIPLVNQVLSPELTVTLSAGARTVEVAQQAHTRAFPVTAENRRLNWIETLAPIPAPGAFSLAYMAQGNWYVLRDNGAGQIAGADPGFGAGTLNYTNGSMSVTLGALPDAGSQIMLTWATPVHYTQRTGSNAANASVLRMRYTLAAAPVVPGTLSITYPVGGTPRTLTDSAENGQLTGAAGASGTIDYAAGEITLEFTQLPDRGQLLMHDYTARDGAGLYSGTTATVSGNSFTIPGTAPFRNGGSMTFLLGGTDQDAHAYITSGGQVRVRGNRERRTSTYDGYTHWSDQAVGTFDASTGVVTLTGGINATRATWDVSTNSWSRPSVSLSISSVADIKVERDTAAFDPDAITGEGIDPAAVGLVLQLAETVADPVVSNSVQFALTGLVYEDRAGTLYTNIDPQTGSGLPAGSIDYTSGEATVTFWADGVPAGINVTALLTRYGQWSAIEASMRAAASPLSPESLSITATTMDGEQISGQGDQNGDIVGAAMRGSVNYEFGTAWVEFGAEQGGEWVPREVDPTSIRYNAVAFSYLPLDADILGIDPVRLPSDGRVPIFRPGDIVMVMHAAETAPVTVSNGGAVDCGRTRLGWVRVIDANGDSVVEGFELDRAAGVVTFTDVAEITMPVTVRHTVADLRQITDAQINGELTLSRPLTHNYPAGESLVASCLIHGDRRARVSATWDQQTWNGTWSDTPQGNEATASLDLIAHPITVTNEGAETERWLLRWTSTTNVELIGERRGLVFSGPFNADIAPINPRTRDSEGQGGVPYLTIPVAANGGGWSAGNVVRINTVGAIADLWIARAIQQSDEPMDDGADGCELYALGNIDRP